MARRRPRLITWVFGLVMLSTFDYFVAVGAITPTLPRYVEGPLGGDELLVGIVVGAFAISAVLLRPFVGAVGDRRGRRILIVGGGLLVGVSILGYALGESLAVLMAMRILTGVGEAAFYVGAASVINDISPDERRGEALSYFSLALFGGLAVGPILGESILDAFGFDWVWVVAGASATVAGLLGLLVPETRPEGAGAERGALINRGALLPGAVLATNIWALATFNSFLPLYALDLGLSGSRMYFVVHSAVVMSVRLFGARLPDRLGPTRASIYALSATGVGMAVMGMWDDPGGLLVAVVIYSIGHSLAFPALMTLALSRSPARERGSAVGTFTAFFDLSFGIGAAGAGAVAAATGFRGAFFTATAVAVVGMMLMAGHGRRRAVAQPAEVGSEAA